LECSRGAKAFQPRQKPAELLVRKGCCPGRLGPDPGDRCLLFELQDQGQGVLAVLIVAPAPIRFAEAVGGVEAPRRPVGDSNFEGDRVGAHRSSAGQSVFEEAPSVASVAQARIRRDLVDMELFVERDGEEITADPRDGSMLSRKDTRVAVRLDDFGFEELALPGHSE
jgi:hypothetical protein